MQLLKYRCNHWQQCGKGGRTIRTVVGGIILSVCLIFGGATASAAHSGINGYGADEAKPASPQPQRAAIVIDDFGNKMGGTEQMIKVPIKLTVAIMPFLETTARDANLAHDAGHDVILHMPMEPFKGKKSWLGPGALTVDLPDEEVRRRVEQAIDQVPHAIGMNNHMGSKVTADKRMMRIVMEVCKERGLFYLDSKTNANSVAKQVGDEVGVLVLQNDLFLDDVGSKLHISKQLQLLHRRLTKQPLCIAIGHVGIHGKTMASTLAVEAEHLQKQGVSFVGLSQIVRERPVPSSGSNRNRNTE